MEINELLNRRRMCEIEMLTIDRLIADESPTALKAMMAIPQTEINSLQSIEVQSLCRLQVLTESTPLYLMRNYSNISKMVEAVQTDTKIANLLAETSSTKAGTL